MPKTTVKGVDKIEKKEGEVSLKAELEKGKEEAKKEKVKMEKERGNAVVAEKSVKPKKVEKKEKEEVVEGKPEEKKGEKPAAEEKKVPEWDPPDNLTEIAEEKGKVEKTVLPEKEKEIIPEKASPIEGIIAQVEKMTVLELSELVKALEERFEVVAAAPAPVGMVHMGAPAEEALEKTEWSVILASVGEKKIQVIKEVRAVTSLGLKEAKTLVEEAPKPVKEGLPQKEAEEIKAKLEAVGATVELK